MVEISYQEQLEFAGMDEPSEVDFSCGDIYGSFCSYKIPRSIGQGCRFKYRCELKRPLTPTSDTSSACNCKDFTPGALTGGWMCPVHGRQF